MLRTLYELLSIASWPGMTVAIVGYLVPLPERWTQALDYYIVALYAVLLWIPIVYAMTWPNQVFTR